VTLDSRIPLIDIRDVGKFITPALLRLDVYDGKNFTCAAEILYCDAGGRDLDEGDRVWKFTSAKWTVDLDLQLARCLLICKIR
jgi:hypothetical protein